MVRKENAIFVGGSDALTLGERLRLFRHEKGLSLDGMAHILNYSKTHLSNVENGRSPASLDLLNSYKYKLNFDPYDENFRKPFSALVNVVYLRNRFFTGRDKILNQLFTKLFSNQESAMCALVGLAGIGKTHIAIEYLYRYRRNYQAVFWLNGYSSEALVADMANIASQLRLSTASDSNREEQPVIDIRDWLKRHTRCLLVVDDLRDLEKMRAVFDLINQLNGHIILTSRVNLSWLGIPSIQLEKMTEEESVLFLLRSAEIISYDSPLADASEKDVVSALEIANASDRLPMHLEQASVWIKKNRHALSSYLADYKKAENERKIDGR